MLKIIDINESIYKIVDKLPEVTEKAIYNTGTSQFTSKGSFSLQIFGNTKKNTCTCGLIQGEHNDNVRCNKCGVLCSSDEHLRKKTFAKIKLFAPIFNPIFTGQLQKLIGNKLATKLLFNTNSGFHLNKDKCTIEEGLLEYNVEDGTKLRDNWAKVNSNLEKINKIISTPVNDNNNSKLNEARIIYKKTQMYKELILPIDNPLNITTMYHLKNALHWLIFESKNNVWAKMRYKWDILFINAIPVSPAGTRALNLDTLDYVSQQYDNIITILNNDTLTYDAKIRDVFSTFYNLLFRNDVNDKGMVIQAYHSKKSVIREIMVGKTVVLSSMSVITADPTIPPDTIRQHKKALQDIFHSVWLHEYYNKTKTDNESINNILRKKLIKDRFDKDSEEWKTIMNDVYNYTQQKFDNDEPLMVAESREPVLTPNGVSYMRVLPAKPFKYTFKD